MPKKDVNSLLRLGNGSGLPKAPQFENVAAETLVVLVVGSYSAAQPRSVVRLLPCAIEASVARRIDDGTWDAPPLARCVAELNGW
eukprot:366258-Chlamydomonas_euryale.AAC.7